jgi:hypothetical protein
MRPGRISEFAFEHPPTRPGSAQVLGDLEPSAALLDHGVGLGLPMPRVIRPITRSSSS